MLSVSRSIEEDMFKALILHIFSLVDGNLYTLGSEWKALIISSYDFFASSIRPSVIFHDLLLLAFLVGLIFKSYKVLATFSKFFDKLSVNSNFNK